MSLSKKAKKVRLHFGTKWVTYLRGKCQPSDEFFSFTQQYCGPYRWQNHGSFITVVFEKEHDTFWFNLTQ